MPFGENPLKSLMRKERFEKRGTEAQSNAVPTPAVERAQTLIAKNEILLDEFADLYGEETVARDKAYVKKREADILKGAEQLEPEARKRWESVTKASTVFEAMAFEGIQSHRWLGPDAVALKTSRFDDIAHGVDLMAEIQRGQDPAQHLALAIDVTFGERAQQQKFENIRKEIESGKLGRIKYFRSDRNGFRGELSIIPKVVIGIEPQNVARMSQLWLQDPGKLKILPAQMAILEEITRQMEAFGTFAKNKGVTQAVRAYDRARSIIEPIRTRKQREMQYQSLDSDRVYRAIIESADKFNS
jgi:hypothetical protein